MLTFRLYQVSDFSVLEMMILALYREDMAGEPMTPAKIRRTVKTLTAHPDKGRILIFQAEQNIVGYALLIPFWSNEFGGDILTIDELYVQPAWRSRGIATRFFDYLTTFDPQSIVGFQLEVTPDNELALAFYRRLGFEFSGNYHLFKFLS